MAGFTGIGLGVLCHALTTHGFPHDLPIAALHTAAPIIAADGTFGPDALDLEVLGGLWAGDGSLVQDQRSGGNTFLWNIHFNRYQAEGFAQELADKLTAKYGLDGHKIGVVTPLGKGREGELFIYTGHKPIVAALVNDIAPHVQWDNKRAQLLHCYDVWGLGTIPLKMPITAKTLAGMALADGTLTVDRGVMTPNLSISGGLANVPLAEVLAFKDSISGSSLSVTQPKGKHAGGFKVYLNGDHNLQADILLNMASVFDHVHGSPGQSAFLAYCIIALKLAWHVHWRRYPSSSARRVVNGLAWFIAYNKWTERVEARGGLAVLKTLPVGKPGDRYHRSTHQHKRACMDGSAVCAAWDSHNAPKDKVLAVYDTLVRLPCNQWKK